MIKVSVDESSCNGCGTCVEVCLMGVYEIKNKKSTPIRPERCLACRACEGTCLQRAIQILD